MHTIDNQDVVLFYVDIRNGTECVINEIKLAGQHSYNGHVEIVR